MKSDDRKRDYSQWELLVKEQEKSNKTQKVFCAEKNIVLSQFVYYRSVLKSKAKPKPKTLELFSPVKINPTKSVAATEIKIILPNGFHCIISSAMKAADVKCLVEALLSC